MILRIIFIVFLSIVVSENVGAQVSVKTTDLFKRTDPTSGDLYIVQNPVIDSLLGRYITMNKKIYDQNGYYGMDGYRIQIYNSSNRNAREEYKKVFSEFVNRFPYIEAYPLYSQPAYFKVRVGDFRTKTEAAKFLLEVSKVFPDAYLVPDFIKFPELNKR
ncbi:MAG TPA: SPOR domain-containing protein [Bacteroidales bacterium]|nr:SPOR domain-containing protein [Bacteroidales bacterium]